MILDEHLSMHAVTLKLVKVTVAYVAAEVTLVMTEQCQKRSGAATCSQTNMSICQHQRWTLQQ